MFCGRRYASHSRPSNTSIPMFRTTVPVDEHKKLVKARLYITSRGIYECRINGKEITDRLLAPGLTQYDKRMNYQTYDITKQLAAGKNGVGVTLASGWWSDAQTFTVRNYNYFGDKEAVLAKIVLTYEDGSRKVFTTNTQDWKYYGEGPYMYSGFLPEKSMTPEKQMNMRIILMEHMMTGNGRRQWS